MQMPIIQMGKNSFMYWQTKHSFEEGHGLRRDEQYVSFEKKFSAIPSVQVSFSYLDTCSKYNQRVRTFPINVSKGGFTIALETWADSKVMGVEVSWLAVLT